VPGKEVLSSPVCYRDENLTLNAQKCEKRRLGQSRALKANLRAKIAVDPESRPRRSRRARLLEPRAYSYSLPRLKSWFFSFTRSTSWLVIVRVALRPLFAAADACTGLPASACPA
jgi:hypothetical protein